MNIADKKFKADMMDITYKKYMVDRLLQLHNQHMIWTFSGMETYNTYELRYPCQHDSIFMDSFKDSWNTIMAENQLNFSIKELYAVENSTLFDVECSICKRLFTVGIASLKDHPFYTII